MKYDKHTDDSGATCIGARVGDVLLIPQIITFLKKDDYFSCFFSSPNLDHFEDILEMI